MPSVEVDSVNAENFNDLLQRVAQESYFKPRLCEWPLGGYTRKQAHVRSSTGVMDLKNNHHSNNGYAAHPYVCINSGTTRVWFQALPR